MATQVTLNSGSVDSAAGLKLRTNGTTEAVDISTGQVVTVAKDTVVNGLTVGRGAGAVSTNTAVGASALASGSQTGTQNTVAGWYASSLNTSGSNNVSYGAQALYSNTTGGNNAGLGTNALLLNTTGSYNTAIGTQALNANTTASNNTAVGYQAGYSNTTGIGNAFFGDSAGYSSNTSGTVANTFIGRYAGYYVTTGTKNTILGGFNGNQGGLDIRTNSNHIVLSDGDGNPRGFFDGSGNYFIGNDRTTAATGGVVVATGFRGRAGTAGAQSNTFNINWTGNPFLWIDTTNVGQISTTSDYRLKENVVSQTEPALPKVMQLNPVKFNRKSEGIFVGSDAIEEGFLAHELQAVIPSAVLGEKDALTEDGGIQPQTLNWAPIVSILTKAIQELKAEFDAYKEAHP